VKKAISYGIISLGLFICLFTPQVVRSSPPADLVVHNGNIYTLDSDQPTPELVAVKEGRVVFVGARDGGKPWIGPHTRVLDLRGRTMTPGLIDSHTHILMLGYAKMILDLSAARNYEEVVDMVKAAAAKVSPGEWILGRGWHQSKWQPPPKQMVKGFQTHHLLSRVTPDNPVFLTHASGHAALVNARALEIADINAQTPSPDGGEIIRDDAGNPTGIFTENAQKLIRRHIPGTTPRKDRRALELAIETALASGITSVQDAYAGADAIELYRFFLAEGRLKIRLWVMLGGSDPDLLNQWYQNGPEIGSGNHFLTIRAIKLVADGALGSRGAWLLQPYADRPGHYGHATIPMALVYQTARDALVQGFQLGVHAIGDRANREVLDQFEKAFRENPDGAGDHRFRIEHAQHISAADIPRFAKLGVIASMQTIHFSSDRPWAIDRLGSERIEEGAYVWQKLLKSGAVVANGTDAPVEPIDPIANFYAAVTRKTLMGQPPGGYEPDQKMTRPQALRSYTLDAAYAAFEDDIKGSITVGKLADFTVFSQDILQVPEKDILSTRIDYTIVNGQIAYERGSTAED
jgi:predicted amidohydrolase YtcJ